MKFSVMRGMNGVVEATAESVADAFTDQAGAMEQISGADAHRPASTMAGTSLRCPCLDLINPSHHTVRGNESHSI